MPLEGFLRSNKNRTPEKKRRGPLGVRFTEEALRLQVEQYDTRKGFRSARAKAAIVVIVFGLFLIMKIYGEEGTAPQGVILIPILVAVGAYLWPSKMLPGIFYVSIVCFVAIAIVTLATDYSVFLLDENVSLLSYLLYGVVENWTSWFLAPWLFYFWFYPAYQVEKARKERVPR